MSPGSIGQGARAAGAGIVIVSLVSLLATIASAQQAEPPEPLTGDPAIESAAATATMRHLRGAGTTPEALVVVLLRRSVWPPPRAC